MNYSIIRYMVCFIMGIEALAMIPPTFLALYDGDGSVALAFTVTMALLLIAFIPGRKKPRYRTFFAREGFATVGLVWLILSLFGALPFWMSGHIPSLADAFFEAVSGFTTSGATILSDVEALPRGLILWRSLSNFMGALGVLVFVLAIVPLAESSDGSSLYLLRAESTGPQVTKLLPKMRDSAKMLYSIYIVLTLVMVVFLLVGGMPLFDSVNTAMCTTATGGFAIKNDSMAGYSSYLQGVTGIFMVLSGINFNIFFLLIFREVKKALSNEELRIYGLVMGGSIALITANLILSMELTVGKALGQAAFQVASIMTTTGFATADYNLWPGFSKAILLVLMILGACAGSTGGGIKITRAIILVKSAKNNMIRTLRPRQVKRVMLDGRGVEEEVVAGVLGYMTMYAILAVLSFLIISLDRFSVETNLTTIIAALNNIGPGLGQAGPAESFADFSILSKLTLSLDMLIGRLELFPMLLLFSPSIWKRGR